MLQRIHQIDDLDELKEYLSTFADVEQLREELFAEFLKYSRYKDAGEWNNAVRLCECLAIAGWGDREAVEAVRGSYFNGNPNTYFLNRDSKPRYFDAVWSKRKEGLSTNPTLSTFHKSPDAPHIPDIAEDIGECGLEDTRLDQQRNWISKNPIFITRGLANCYENSKSMIASMETELRQMLNHGMRPELYGTAIDRIVINCSFSFYDNYHCKTNYIIADEALKLKQKDFYPALLEMYSEKEIEDNGYYLRNRFSYGPFRKDTGTMTVVIVFEREFSELAPDRQKQVLCGYLMHAVDQCAERLRKKIEYNFDRMKADLSAILSEWCGRSIG